MSTKFRENHGMFGVNYVLEGDGFHISYNPKPINPFRMIGIKVFDMAPSDGPETALVLTKPGAIHRYLILNGDFRAEYEEAFERGLDGCMAVYEANRAVANSGWTTRDVSND